MGRHGAPSKHAPLVAQLRGGNSVIALLVPTAASQLSLLTTGVLVARLLGVDGRGVVALATLFPALAAFVGSLGTAQLASILVARYGNARRLFGLLARLSRVAIALSTLTSFGIVAFATGDLILAVVGALTVLPTVRIAQMSAVLYGLSKYWLAGLMQLWGPFCYAIGLVVTALFLPLDPLTVTTVWSLTAYVALVISALMFRSATTADELPNPDMIGASEIRRRAWKGLIGTYPPLESFRVDQLAVSSFAGTYQLGIYVGGLAFANLPKLAGQTLAVKIARAPDVAAARRLAVKLMALVLLLAAVTAALCPFLVPALFGASFAPAILPAVLLVATGGLMGVRKIVTELLRYSGAEGVSSALEIIGLAAFAACCLLPVVRTTALGVAVALAAVSILTCALSFGYLVRVRGSAEPIIVGPPAPTR